jgi:hypothetical protein
MSLRCSATRLLFGSGRELLHPLLGFVGEQRGPQVSQALFYLRLLLGPFLGRVLRFLIVLVLQRPQVAQGFGYDNLLVALGFLLAQQVDIALGSYQQFFQA